MARTILVVEDEPTLRETLAEALEADGFRVTVAADGRVALEHALLRPRLGTASMTLTNRAPHVDGASPCSARA